MDRVSCPGPAYVHGQANEHRKACRHRDPCRHRGAAGCTDGDNIVAHCCAHVHTSAASFGDINSDSNRRSYRNECTFAFEYPNTSTSSHRYRHDGAGGTASTSSDEYTCREVRGTCSVWEMHHDGSLGEQGRLCGYAAWL
ncbi:MAG: hypothetical protein FJ026_02540 [Chloroflexi bacterium]|nr:hypothetical protein [Chloroflexota bacterium]